jgi:hypothetical protein
MVVLPIGWTCIVVAQRRLASDQRSTRQATGALLTGMAFAGLILLASLAERLAGGLGTAELLDGFGQRATMILVGAYLVLTGNTMPKTLVPLASLQCDGTRTQAFLRVAGWIWVLIGLAFVVSWLALPIALAKPVSLITMLGGILIIASLVFRLHLTRRRDA